LGCRATGIKKNAWQAYQNLLLSPDLLYSIKNLGRAAHRFHGPPDKYSVRAPKLSQPIRSFSIIRNIDSTIPYLLANITCKQYISAALAKKE
jgi:hypothetical protein